MVVLLAVIAIIGILMAIALGAFTGVREQAWRTRSRTLARQLAQAWNQHLLYYREFPANVPEESNADHLRILNTGRTNGTYFLDVKRAEWGTGLRDKWGDYFKVELDTDYDGTVSHPFSNENVRASVIVWSERFGPPGGTPPRPQATAKTEDDIVVW
jgi:type II secretory pathway pseudopilin PulG